jgi:uncharacterized protein (DUF2141 family)
MRLIQTICCGAALLAATLAGAADLTIHIDDVKTARGQVMVELYNSTGAFLKSTAGSGSTAAALKDSTVVLKDLPAGEYAFAVYHDANSNGKMDKNLMGIPTEDYAFSNNALGKMGPPSFDSARFTLPAAGATMRVSLR